MARGLRAYRDANTLVEYYDPTADPSIDLAFGALCFTFRLHLICVEINAPL